MVVVESSQSYSVRERDLYESVESYLNLRFRDSLKPIRGECLTFSAIAASSAGKLQAGQWTRPDVALIAVWKNKYSPTVNLDLYGFEVKTRQGCTVSAVHEALAQNRLVHYSFLVWHVPDSEFSSKRFLDIHESCGAHGVGLITFRCPINDASSFTVHLQPKRAQPTLDAIDDFIETRFAKVDRERILQFLPSFHEVRGNR